MATANASDRLVNRLSAQVEKCYEYHVDYYNLCKYTSQQCPFLYPALWENSLNNQIFMSSSVGTLIAPEENNILH